MGVPLPEGLAELETLVHAAGGDEPYMALGDPGAVMIQKCEEVFADWSFGSRLL